MFRQHIYNKLEKESLEQKQLAKVANVNESTISRYLNGHDELKFESILKIVKYLFPEQEKEYIAEYALTQKSQNARHCMEYCMIHRLWHITEQLVDKLAVSTNPADREWAKIYELVLIYANKKMDPDLLLEETKKFYPNAIEVQIMHTFLVGYIYFDMYKDHIILEYLENMDKQIEKVKSQFLQDCFHIRLGLLMNNIYLYNNEIQKSRNYSLKVVEQDVAEHVKAKAFQVLGNTYLYEDYEKAIQYLDESIYFFKKVDSEREAYHVIQTITFTNSYWNVDFEFPLDLKNDIDINYYAYYLYKRGEIDRAQDMINQIDSASLSDWDKGFYYYFKALIEKDKKLFYHSVKWFRSTENLFHLQLPIKELQELGEESVLLEIFTQWGK